jgi:hypothetical protein
VFGGLCLVIDVCERINLYTLYTIKPLISDIIVGLEEGVEGLESTLNVPTEGRTNMFKHN